MMCEDFKGGGREIFEGNISAFHSPYNIFRHSLHFCCHVIKNRHTAVNTCHIVVGLPWPCDSFGPLHTGYYSLRATDYELNEFWGMGAAVEPVPE
jgi:hypothetical protein